MISWPIEILFGFLMSGLAASSSSSVNPNRLAIFDSVSFCLIDVDLRAWAPDRRRSRRWRVATG